MTIEADRAARQKRAGNFELIISWGFFSMNPALTQLGLRKFEYLKDSWNFQEHDSEWKIQNSIPRTVPVQELLTVKKISTRPKNSSFFEMNQKTKE